MSETVAMGTIIANLRKSRDITQEELGRAVGVSMQAVSKWENGGLPDTELLPAIADKLGVSVDSLFGREISEENLILSLCRHFANMPNSELVGELFEYLWAVQQNRMGFKKDYSSWWVDKDSYDNSYSEVLEDNGFTLMCLDHKKPYFALFPKSDERAAQLFDIGEQGYAEFFAILGDVDVIRALRFFSSRENKPFTPHLLVKNLSVTTEKSTEILEKLRKYNFVKVSEIELDEEIQMVYEYRSLPYIVPFLTFAHNFIKNPCSFMYYCGNTSKPYLK